MWHYFFLSPSDLHELGLIVARGSAADMTFFDGLATPLATKGMLQIISPK
jgi:hypothetical protein